MAQTTADSRRVALSLRGPLLALRLGADLQLGDGQVIRGTRGVNAGTGT